MNSRFARRGQEVCVGGPLCRRWRGRWRVSESVHSNSSRIVHDRLTLLVDANALRDVVAVYGRRAGPSRAGGHDEPSGGDHWLRLGLARPFSGRWPACQRTVRRKKVRSSSPPPRPKSLLISRLVSSPSRPTHVRPSAFRAQFVAGAALASDPTPAGRSAGACWRAPCFLHEQLSSSSSSSLTYWLLVRVAN